MARTVKATMPSGEVVELEGVPETATEAQIRAKVQAKLGEAPTELSTSWLDTAKVLGSAAGRGVATLGAMVQDVGRNWLIGIREGGEVLTGQRKVSDMQPLTDKFKHVGEVAGMGTQPITTGQRYGASVTEGAAGGLLGGVVGWSNPASLAQQAGLGQRPPGRHCRIIPSRGSPGRCSGPGPPALSARPRPPAET